MKEKLLYALWGCLYILCVGLGQVENPQGFGKLLLILSALIFFLPGGALVYLGIREKNRKTLLGVRVVCIVSLSLTLCLLIANLFTVRFSAAVGSILHELLALVSAPMLCSQYWVLSLFLWACLLFASCKKVN